MSKLRNILCEASKRAMEEEIKEKSKIYYMFVKILSMYLV